ncbi:ankyrin repeat domain-containing protein [Undibacterium sp. Ji50W]|uniref:ankyrin repeat domain-containing protein n=1 Tax=Undibacterium sp. Ji50W TaxID=3413041 RepID=UPI003BF082ED
MKFDEQLISFIYRSDIEGVRQSLSAGASTSVSDSDGRDALMHAILSSDCNPAIVSLLLASGANPNHKDRGQNWSALAFAARGCDREICSLLLDNGAEIDPVDVFDNTPLWRAVMAKREEIVSLLVSRGANPDLANKSGVSPRILAQRLGVSYFT